MPTPPQLENEPPTQNGTWHQQRDEDFFQEVGKKVESLRSSDGKSAPNVSEDSDDPPQPVDEIESLCMNCHEQGTTRLMLTRIPFFREVVLTSFHCPHCHFRDSEIQSAGVIQPFASRYTFALASTSDFSRQVIKSETCTARFIELDIEIPAGRGQITNVESLLTTLIEDLEFSQPTRRALDEDVWRKIEEKLERGRKMLKGDEWPVTLVLDDIAGNSSIQPSVDNRDKRWGRSEYKRSKEQDDLLGLGPETADAQDVKNKGGEDVKASLQRELDSEIVPDEVYSFPATCPECMKHCSTHMKMVDIPHFKEVVIMSTVCDHCGCEFPQMLICWIIPRTYPPQMQIAATRSRPAARCHPEADASRSESTTPRISRATSSNPSHVRSPARSLVSPSNQAPSAAALPPSKAS
jgi:zinc finger protein